MAGWEGNEVIPSVLVHDLRIMLPGESRLSCMSWHVFLGSDMYYTDPAQHIVTAVAGFI